MATWVVGVVGVLLSAKISRFKTLYYVFAAIVGVVAMAVVASAWLPNGLKTLGFVVGSAAHAAAASAAFWRAVPAQYVAAYVCASAFAGMSAAHVMYLHDADVATSPVGDVVFAAVALASCAAAVLLSAPNDQLYVAAGAMCALALAAYDRRRGYEEIDDDDDDDDTATQHHAVRRDWEACDATRVSLVALVNSPAFKNWVVSNAQRIHVDDYHN